MKLGSRRTARAPADAVSGAGESRGAHSLRVDEVTKRFGGVAALTDVSFTVAPAAATGVIGPNGAGKSTLLKLVAGVHRPSSGTVRYGPVSLARLAPHKVASLGIGLAHQVPRPFRGLTVAENVAIGAASAPVPSRRRSEWVEHVVETCGLAHRSRTPAGELQLLDLKRLELARALSVDPTLILLDEVAAGLSGRDLDQIIDLVGRLKGEGRGLLLVEHVEGVIASLCDRVIVIDWGKVIADGTPAEVAANERVRSVYLGDDGSTVAGEDDVQPLDPERAKRAEPLPKPPDGERGTNRDRGAAHHGEPPSAHAAGDGSSGASADLATATLQLESVTAGYGDIVALHEIELEVRSGEVVAVFGANGAGKSTLVGTASGLVRPRGGVVRFHGDAVTRLAAHARNRLGIAHCPEGRRVFTGLSVRENLVVAVPLWTRRSRVRERLDAVYDVFPVLAGLARRDAGTLSGGQQQMLASGRAFMSEPDLLLCDEISLGLAPVAIDALYTALERIRAHGVSVLLVEQNVHRGLALADRAYVLDRGRVSYSGDPAPLGDKQTLDRFYFGDFLHGPTGDSAVPLEGQPS